MELDADKIYGILANLATRQSVDDLAAEFRKVAEELKTTQYTHEAKIASIEKDIKIVQENVERIDRSLIRAWEHINKQEHRPEREAFEREQETKKVARSTVVRMAVTIILSGVLALAVILVEKKIMSG